MLVRLLRRARGPLRLAFVIGVLGIAAPWIADQIEIAQVARRLATLAVFAVAA